MTIKSSGVQWRAKPAKRTLTGWRLFSSIAAMGTRWEPNTIPIRASWYAQPGGADLARNRSKNRADEGGDGGSHYKERDHKVFLSPWSKLTRDTLTLEAGPADVTLDSGALKQVDTTQAHGTDQRPARTLDYSANQLSLEFNDNNQIQKITGTDQARLVNKADTTVTTLTGDRVVMDFDTSGNDSLLQNALVGGTRRDGIEARY